MRKPILIAAVLVQLLLFGSAAARAPERVAASIASGGGYVLMTSACQPIALTGGGYVLKSMAAPAAPEDGCCCLFVPLTLR